ncbi:MAG: DUF1049 domain-containing protein [Okeania sp. SIO2H7]|nr:DUF1049 domain-containing protein [Okeania sp. SIO2H7]
MMKALTTVTIAVLLALWVVAIAVLSIQNVFVVDTVGNATLVSLKFLGLSSIQLPLGVTLALSAAIGMVATSLLLFIFTMPYRFSRHHSTRRS